MKKREIQASVGQRLLWLKNDYEGQNGTLNCPVICRMEGPVDSGLLRSALGCLVAQHESLRTTFVHRGSQLRQVIHELSEVRIEFCDLSDAEDPQGAVEGLVKKELGTSIDPAEWPSRVTLWRLGEENYLLCINLHHLVTDTWSCMVLQRELVLAYEQCLRGNVRLAQSGWQFSQFMAWQGRQLEGGGFQRHSEYWRSHLAGASMPRLPLSPSKPRTAGTHASITANIDMITTQRLRKLAGKYRTTLFTVALSAYKLLLSHVTGQMDLAVSTLFANRTRPEVENTVGFLTNLAVLRTQLNSVATFADVIERVRATVLNGMAHQEFPYHLAAQRAFVSVTPRPDDVVFQMLNEQIDKTYQTSSLEFQGLIPDVGGRFAFEMALMPLRDSLAVKLDYAKDRLSSDWARDFVLAFIALTAAVAADPSGPLNKLLTNIPSLAMPNAKLCF